MLVRGERPYLSLAPFETVDLPDLVVLTGRNGSGKSQFLQALEQNHISTDLFGALPETSPRAPTPPNHQIIRLENSSGLSLALDKPVASTINQRAAPRPPRPHVNFDFAQARARVLAPITVELQNIFQIEQIELEDPLSLLVEEPSHLADRLGIPGRASDLQSIFDQADQILLGSTRSRADPNTDAFLARIRATTQRLRILPRSVTRELLEQLDSWGGFPAFDPAVTKIFAAYRDARFMNRMQRLEDEDTGSKIALSDAGFREAFGNPPWILLNDTLQLFGLGYEVSAPPLDIQQPVKFVLKRLDNGVEVNVGQLSSGERVLLRFALSLFDYDPLRVGVSMPKLLLLDEMDASLHPEMVGRWLTALRTLVEQRGVTCIITTHSPTTVALAAEGSLFELATGGAPRKVTKQEALNRLTFGVPTLSIDYSGRRQVFVESDTDAASYETLESVLKARVPLERTLTFLSTGLRKAGQEVGTGCAVVTKIVSELAAHGNASVYGLLDWDGANRPSDRIHVIGQGTHYALDNLLLDPLLIGALLLRDLTKLTGTTITFNGLGSIDPAGLQQLVDLIERPIGYPASDATLAKSRYLGGVTLSVRAQHQQMNGHALEDLIIAAHPSLTRYSNGGRGKLTDNVVKRVLVDYPEFCPQPIADVFREIASAET